MSKPCPTCNGLRRVPEGDVYYDICYTCNGTGTVEPQPAEFDDETDNNLAYFNLGVRWGKLPAPEPSETTWNKTDANSSLEAESRIPFGTPQSLKESKMSNTEYENLMDLLRRILRELEKINDSVRPL